jgi:hypothetical protein
VIDCTGETPHHTSTQAEDDADPATPSYRFFSAFTKKILAAHHAQLTENKYRKCYAARILNTQFSTPNEQHSATP